MAVVSYVNTRRDTATKIVQNTITTSTTTIITTMQHPMCSVSIDGFVALMCGVCVVVLGARVADRDDRRGVVAVHTNRVIAMNVAMSCEARVDAEALAWHATDRVRAVVVVERIANDVLVSVRVVVRSTGDDACCHSHVGSTLCALRVGNARV